MGGPVSPLKSDADRGTGGWTSLSHGLGEGSLRRSMVLVLLAEGCLA